MHRRNNSIETLFFIKEKIKEQPTEPKPTEPQGIKANGGAGDNNAT